MSSKSTIRTYILMAITAIAIITTGCTDEKIIRTNSSQGQKKANNNNNSGKKNTGNNQKKTPATFDVEIFATSNPAGAAKDYIVGLDDDLKNMANLYKIPNIRSIQSIALDDDGDAMVTYDAENNSDGGVKKFGNLPTKSNQKPSISPRTVDGSDAPKGLVWVKDTNGDQLNFDALIVADVGDSNDAGSIRVYNVDSGTPDLAFTVTDLGDADKKVWDMAYDKASDRLFVTRTDGVLLIYQAFFVQQQNVQNLIRVTPVDNNDNKVSVNLHGIAYDADDDNLVLSDVGDPKKADDGKIFVFEDFFQTVADQGNLVQNVEVTGMLSGDKTKLGNPVDIIVKDDDLYVAEKSNDLIMKFDDIFDLDESKNDAADKSIKVVKPESLAVKP